MNNVSKNVPVLLNDTVYTDTCKSTFRNNVTSLHALNIDDAGNTQTLLPHKYPSAFTLRHMSLDKLLDASSNLRPNVKTLLSVQKLY